MSSSVDIEDPPPPYNEGGSSSSISYAISSSITPGILRNTILRYWTIAAETLVQIRNSNVSRIANISNCRNIKICGSRINNMRITSGELVFITDCEVKGTLTIKGLDNVRIYSTRVTSLNIVDCRNVSINSVCVKVLKRTGNGVFHRLNSSVVHSL